MAKSAKNRYASLRHFMWRYKNHPDFKSYMSARIFRLAKDEKIELEEFAFLIKKSLKYIKLKKI